MEVYGADSRDSEARDPHCAQHTHFVESCAVCKQARANFLPYPVRAEKPLPRSFGLTDDITEENLRGPTRGRRSFRYDPTADPDANADASLSLVAIRFLLKLIWPFGRIL